MNLNQLIDRMTNEELSMPFNLHVEVPRYIRDLEDFEISADSVEDFFDYDVADEYLLSTVAYIDYKRVTVYIDLNDLIVTGYGYEEYDNEGSYCVTAYLEGELLDRYGNPLSESVKRSSEKSGRRVNENNNHRKINEDLLHDVGGEYEKYLGPHISSDIYEYSTKLYLLARDVKDLNDSYIDLISDKQRQQIFDYLDILRDDVAYLNKVINDKMK